MTPQPVPFALEVVGSAGAACHERDLGVSGTQRGNKLERKVNLQFE